MRIFTCPPGRQSKGRCCCLSRLFTLRKSMKLQEVYLLMVIKWVNNAWEADRNQPVSVTCAAEELFEQQDGEGARDSGSPAAILLLLLLLLLLHHNHFSFSSHPEVNKLHSAVRLDFFPAGCVPSPCVLIAAVSRERDGPMGLNLRFVWWGGFALYPCLLLGVGSGLCFL